MRIIVTGCRDWADEVTVGASIARVTFGWASAGGVVSVGDCPTGVDEMMRRFAEAKPNWLEGWEVDVFRAYWDIDGKAAGPMRNQRMVDQGAELCLAFWDGKSRGTLDCLSRATAAGIPVRIIPKAKP